MEPRAVDFLARWKIVDVDYVGNILRFTTSDQQPDKTDHAYLTSVFEIFPWFRVEWLTDHASPRIVRDAARKRWIVEIASENKGVYTVFARDISAWRETDLLLCEISDEIISVQKFVDTFYDGVFVTDGTGQILVINDAFSQISGIAKQQAIGRNCQDLIDEGLIPMSCSMNAIHAGESRSAVIKYPSGKEGIATSVPLRDANGKIIRIMSNVRDLSELNLLKNKLNRMTALMESYQHELNSMQIMQQDTCRSLIRSAKMENLYALLARVANTDLRLMITGESGVGKTALAKFVHSLSERNKTGSFVHLNCSAIPESLLEAELFGHEEGAYTGAGKGKVGLLETAHKGTLFLDEIGDMPLTLQAKLLNVLQEGAFYRVGGRKLVNINVRFIAATNMDLQQKILSKQFREDLYYRLNAVPIVVPSLAERKEDIPPLVTYYLEQYNTRYHKNYGISSDAMEALVKYHWPGNIRQLSNLLERLVVTCDGANIEYAHLLQVEELRQTMGSTTVLSEPDAAINGVEQTGLWKPHVSLKTILRTLEEKVIDEAIASCSSYKDVANHLGIDVATLFRKRRQSKGAEKAMPQCDLTNAKLHGNAFKHD